MQVCRVVRWTVLAVAGVTLMACQSSDSDKARAEFQNTPSATQLPPGHPPIDTRPEAAPTGEVPSSVAGVAWTAPKGWEPQGPRSMRVATYTIHTNREGTAECAVYYFGTGQGGGIQANIDRWINQFQQPDGTASASHAHTEHAERSGWPLTTVDVSGTYTAGMGPMSQSQEPQMGYRMLAAIVEGPDGPVFFKLTGPEAVVEASRGDFEVLLASLKPAG